MNELYTPYAQQALDGAEAVARQNYRKAARLRRQLDELDGKGNGGGK